MAVHPSPSSTSSRSPLVGGLHPDVGFCRGAPRGYDVAVGRGQPKDDLSTTPLTHDGTLRTVTRSPEPELGARLGQFRVEARIGRGGLGIVCRAYDEKLKRSVALKVLADTSSAAGARLLEEARAAASLMHPSIAAIHDVQQQNGVVFIVMELVAGTTLRAEIKRGSLDPTTVARYARDIAAGLARAHTSGIVHRDLKPENVMVTPEGGAKILDFGLARQAPDSALPSGEVGATGISGTPDYMAPEQARGELVDARADVFSFGVVLYEMLAGKRPFSRAGAEQRGDDSTIETPLKDAAPGAPEQLVRIAERCLSARRDERFADGGEVLDALRSLDESRPKPSRRTAVWVGGLAVLGSGALVAGVVASRSRADGRGGVPSAVPAAAPEPPFALTSSLEAITTAGLCAGFPVFADDGSLVYASQDDKGSEIHRIDPSGRDTALTDDRGSSLRPNRGEPGQIVYMFRKKGEEGGSEVRSVALTGGPPRTLVRGCDPIVASGVLFFIQEDGRAIRRRALDGSGEEVLREAAPSTLFDFVTPSPDGRWLATNTSGYESRIATPLCLGPIEGERGPLDCVSAGAMTSQRATFAPGGRAVYFVRGDSLVRLDLATHAAASVRVSPAPTTLAITPDGGGIALSTCRVVYEAVRVDLGGAATRVPAAAKEAGLLSVGPRGELAFPVAHDAQTSLGLTDAAGSEVRVLTGGDHQVTEIAFSPDGSRVAFHDASRGTGGLFVADVDGARAPTRVTSDADDSAPSWLDAEHVVYLHAEKGVPYGRVTVVSAAGGEPTALPNLPGVLVGAVPARGTVLLGIRSPSGDRFAEATRDGRVHEIVLRGVPKGMQWDIATSASPSGRYVAWYAAGAAWRADLESGVASRVDFPWPRVDADGIQPDDQGRIVASFRHSEGQLYRARGRFP
jgi:serine/threonine protein kinase